MTEDIPIRFDFDRNDNWATLEYIDAQKEIAVYPRILARLPFEQDLDGSLSFIVWAFNHEYLHVVTCRIGHEDNIFDKITNNKTHYIMAAGLDLCDGICFSHNAYESTNFKTHTNGKEETISLEKPQEFFREMFLVKK